MIILETNMGEIYITVDTEKAPITAKNFTDLFVRWNINGRDQAPQDFAKQNQIFLTTNGESGSLQIETGIEGITKLLQKGVGRTTLNINLGT